MKITILGCGASVGVPVIGCECPTCRSENPKNRRMRVSLAVEYEDGFTVLVDTAPDLREQSLAFGLKRIDTIIFTHPHADHCHGIDDVRPFNAMQNHAIDAFATGETLAELQSRFAYVWQPHSKSEYWTSAALHAHEIPVGKAITLENGKIIQTFAQTHGKSETLGLRFGNLVYSTDLNAIPETSKKWLEGMDVWILDCLRDGFSGSHNNLETAIRWHEIYRPKRTILTHMNHELEYEALKSRLPPGMEPGYDGLIIDG